jgi:hypothetical protein
VPCCGPCNLTKISLDPTTFIQRACHVSMHNGGHGRAYPDSFLEPRRPASYAKLKRRAEERGIAFQLTEAQFHRISVNDCEYCGRSPPKKRHGIDRVDSTKGYIWRRNGGDCVAACGDCNIAKGTSTADAFVDRCKLIAARAKATFTRLSGKSAIPVCLEIIKKRPGSTRSSPQRKRKPVTVPKEPAVALEKAVAPEKASCTLIPAPFLPACLPAGN